MSVLIGPKLKLTILPTVQEDHDPSKRGALTPLQMVMYTDSEGSERKVVVNNNKHVFYLSVSKDTWIPVISVDEDGTMCTCYHFKGTVDDFVKIRPFHGNTSKEAWWEAHKATLMLFPDFETFIESVTIGDIHSHTAAREAQSKARFNILGMVDIQKTPSRRFDMRRRKDIAHFRLWFNQVTRQ